MISSTINLYPNKERGTERLYAVQGEAMGRTVTVSLYDVQGQRLDLTTCRVFLQIVKPDRTVAITEGDTTEGLSHQVGFVLPYQACTCAGLCDAIVLVIGTDYELRFDSLELMVSPAQGDAIFESCTDLSVFAQIVRNGDAIGRKLTELSTTRDLMVSVLKNYADQLSPDVTGTLPVGDEEEITALETTVAADLGGNILMLDTNSWGAVNTFYTVDEGATWTQQSPEEENYKNTDNDMYYCCVGGKQFLCIGRKRLAWVKISNGSMTITKTQPVPYSSKINQAVRSAKYVGGKYFLFFSHTEGDGVGSEQPLPPMYFATEGGDGAYLSLPQKNTVALGIAYEDDTWYLLTRTVWQQDQLCTYYFLRSDDLANWHTVTTWRDEMSDYRCFTIRSGAAMVYKYNYTKATAMRIQLDTGSTGEVSLRDTGAFYAHSAVSSDLFDVVLGHGGVICYTKDGKRYTFFEVNFAENNDYTVDIAIPRRRLIVADGAYYAIYRLDMIGENLSEKLNDAKAEYEGLVEKTEKMSTAVTNAAHKVDTLITVSDIPLESGATLETGHLYIVY